MRSAATRVVRGGSWVDSPTASAALRPILTIKSNRCNYIHARGRPSSTSRAAFSCLDKNSDPPTSGCTRFIRRVAASLEPASYAATPRMAEIWASVAFSASLTRTPPNEKKPPSVEASATAWLMA